MISKEEVQHIAQLARIRVDGKDIEKLQQDLSGILEYFGVLQEVVDVSGMEPMTHSITLENVSREDAARPGSPALIQKLIDMFPAAREGFLKVKEILVKRET